MKFFSKVLVLLVIYASCNAINTVARYNNYAGHRSNYPLKEDGKGLPSTLKSLAFDELIFYSSYDTTNTNQYGYSFIFGSVISNCDGFDFGENSVTDQLKANKPNLIIHATLTDGLLHTNNEYSSSFSIYLSAYFSSVMGEIVNWSNNLSTNIDYVFIDWPTIGYTFFGGASTDYQSFYNFCEYFQNNSNKSLSCCAPGFFVNSGNFAIETGTYTTDGGVTTKTVNDRDSYFEWWYDCSQYIDQIHVRSFDFSYSDGTYNTKVTYNYAPLEATITQTSVKEAYENYINAGIDASKIYMGISNNVRMFNNVSSSSPTTGAFQTCTALATPKAPLNGGYTDLESTFSALEVISDLHSPPALLEYVGFNPDEASCNTASSKSKNNNLTLWGSWTCPSASYSSFLSSDNDSSMIQILDYFNGLENLGGVTLYDLDRDVPYKKQGVDTPVSVFPYSNTLLNNIQ